MSSIWEKFLEHMEDNNYIVDGGTSGEVVMEESSHFHFKSEDTKTN